jgi:hypothetical protein
MNHAQQSAAAPGPPHPDPVLAAKGWHLCGCHDPGIYVRDAGKDAARQAEQEREAG